MWHQLFHDGGRYHIETSPLICRANQWTGFYMIPASVMKEFTFLHSANEQKESKWERQDKKEKINYFKFNKLKAHNSFKE